jgi:hypothetical protein
MSSRLGARLGVQELNFRHHVSFEGLGMEKESLMHTKALSDYSLSQFEEVFHTQGRYREKLHRVGSVAESPARA